MASIASLTLSDARRALVRHHFAPLESTWEAFEKLRSIQFDPIAPIGCNHDLVLQARVPDYRIGDWQVLAYSERRIYDGWDKQASLVPFEGWPTRRIFHKFHRRWFEDKIFRDHKQAVEQILTEISDRGPLLPRDCEFQQRREEWKSSWHGPSVTKQTLRALWHSGLVVTSGRQSGQHLYDLAERVVPPRFYNAPEVADEEAILQLVLDRHVTMGLLRPSASPEVWSNEVLNPRKRDAIASLVESGCLIPVEVSGMKLHSTPEFLSLLDLPSLEPKVRFIGPLDPFMWDRKMVGHIFNFEYIWEIYTPVVKRKWGYYVLPVLFGDDLVARAEFWARDGVLELREWHFESLTLGPNFYGSLEEAIESLMRYSETTSLRVLKHVDSKIRNVLRGSQTLIDNN